MLPMCGACYGAKYGGRSRLGGLTTETQPWPKVWPADMKPAWLSSQIGLIFGLVITAIPKYTVQVTGQVKCMADFETQAKTFRN